MQNEMPFPPFVYYLFIDFYAQLMTENFRKREIVALRSFFDGKKSFEDARGRSQVLLSRDEIQNSRIESSSKR